MKFGSTPTPIEPKFGSPQSQLTRSLKALKANESEVRGKRCKQDKEREENLKELTGIPQRFCEAKDLREEEEQAL